MRFILSIYIIILFITFGNAAAQDINLAESEIFYLNEKGVKFIEMGYYDSAEYYLLKTLDLQKIKLGMNHEETAATFVNLGAIYRNVNNYQKALDYFNKAEKFFLENMPNSPYLGYIYNNKGNVYFSYSDFKEAELYYRYCLDFFDRTNQLEYEAYSHAYINLFNIYIEQNRNREAIEFLENFKIPNNTELIFRRHIFLAEAYSRIMDFEEAIEEVTMAKKVYESKGMTDYTDLMIYNYRYATILVNLTEYSKAIDLLIENIKIQDKIKGSKFEVLYETYYLIGKIHYLKGSFKDCISWLNTVILKLSDNITSNPAQSILNDRSYSREIIDFYRLFGKALYQLYLQTENKEYLIDALDKYSISIEYSKAFRLHMRNQESVFLESESSTEIIHEAIEIAAILYNLTSNKIYLDRAFNYAENMKSFSLFSEVKRGEAMKFADLPEEIVEKEQLLDQKLAAYSEMIFEENSSENPDSNTLKILKDSYFKLKDNSNSLLDSIERYYPKYFKLKYNSNFITPYEIQKKLGHKECLVEYVLSDTTLTTFVIDNENINVITQNIDADFADKCFDYFALLQNQDFSNNVHETYRNYVKMGRLFYKTLVEPVLEVTESREITFVPDGEIMYLPFESFLTRDVDTEYIDYHELPYLIYDLSVGYSYSSTLLFSERVKTKSPLNKVLAFAPEYENLLDAELLEEWSRQSHRDFLMPLPGAEKEVEYISRTVPSDVYKDYEATESNFKDTVEYYSVLHLAMHTIMDDENPMYSKLAFARNFNDTVEDHDLFTYEIYNLKLNADMVVLSSCSSGFGKMQKGEGMMSMARGFIYAGCPSIVMTLWQVSDLSSAELMSSFYKHLEKGKSKKNALRDAKIDYIQSSDKLKSNPYFWSAFLMVGDNTPLYRSSPALYLSIIVGAFTLLTLYLMYKRRIFNFIRKRK